MITYLRGEDYGKHLWDKYPEIPYLKVIPEDEFFRKEAETLTAVVEEVLAECHLK